MIKQFKLPTPDEAQIAVKSGDPTGLAIFLSLYAVADSKWRADFTTAINEILEADRAHRGDPRLAELQRLSRDLLGETACYDRGYPGGTSLQQRGFTIEPCERALISACLHLAASPTIDPATPTIPDTPAGRERASKALREATMGALFSHSSDAAVDIVIAALKGEPT
jgi:hypothetical protein